ncbi:hypothetical protein F4604DRAFT_1055211 [Suillus subluteus]|nr:hypothetical protein F4604DRAFT_1055211 [Suillus subluteus]
MSTCTVPSGNYMIESADSKGQFLTVENGNIRLHSKDSHSVQVWKLTISDNWVNFQGVPPDGKEGKIIGVSTGASTLVYGDGILEDFQLENAANNTFRVTFEYYELGLYWQINGDSVGLGVNQFAPPLTRCVQVSFTSNQTYAAKWKLTKCSK